MLISGETYKSWNEAAKYLDAHMAKGMFVSGPGQVIRTLNACSLHSAFMQRIYPKTVSGNFVQTS